MSKDRRGGNKNRTGGPKKAKKRAGKSMRVEKARDKSRKRVAALKAQQPTRSAFEREEVETDQPREATVGTAVVLAHGAGGSSSHASMRAWRERLAPWCDAVLAFDFPRPSTDFARLVEAYAAEAAAAVAAGHRRVVLVGAGLGARVAHLVTGLPAEGETGAGGEGRAGAEPRQLPCPSDAAADAAALPPHVRRAICGVVALGYPLLRRVAGGGACDVRDAARSVHD